MSTTKPDSHRRAAIYCRVSTDEQAKGYSLSTQLDACRKYAEVNGFEVVGAFKDEYSGATPIEARPEGRLAYEMLARGAADALIVYRIDRLVRPPEDGDEWDMPILIRSLAKAGREIHTLDRGKIETSFAGLLIAVLDSKNAGEERRKIAERTSRGRQAKARSKQVVGIGIFPYGYRKTGTGRSTGIEINETEAKIVRLIFEWYVLGDGQTGPMSFSAIALRLTNMQIDTPGASRAHRNIRTRLPYAWDYGTVSYILKNFIYIGEWHWAGEIIPTPPIIGRPLWEEAQKRREYNRKLSQHNKSRNYLLSGMVKCHCGHAMVGTSSPNGRAHDNWYYECTSKKRRHKGIEEICPQPLVRTDRLEEAVWCYVVDLVTDPETFEAALRSAQRLELDKIRPLREQMEHTLELIKEVEHEADELGRALGKAAGIVGQSLERQIAEVNKRYVQLCHTRDRLLAGIEKEALSDQDISYALNFRDDVFEGLQNVTDQDVRKILELLRVQVTVRDQVVTITCRVPVRAEPGEIDLKSSRSLEVDDTRYWMTLESKPIDLAAGTFPGMVRQAVRLSKFESFEEP